MAGAAGARGLGARSRRSRRRPDPDVGSRRAARAPGAFATPFDLLVGALTDKRPRAWAARLAGTARRGLGGLRRRRRRARCRRRSGGSLRAGVHGDPVSTGRGAAQRARGVRPAGGHRLALSRRRAARALRAQVGAPPPPGSPLFSELRTPIGSRGESSPRDPACRSDPPQLSSLHSVRSSPVRPASPRRASAPARAADLELLAAVELTAGLMIDGAPVAAACRASPTTRPAIASGASSDDRSELGPARLYRLQDRSRGLRRRSPRHTWWSKTIAATAGCQGPAEFAKRSLDPEGLALASTGGGFFVSSEGEAKAGLAPFVAEFDAAGRQVRDFPLPPRYLPAKERGVRDNLGLECLGVTPDRRALMVMTEGALVGDGPSADVGVGSVARLRRIELSTGEAQEFLVPLDAVSRPPVPANSFRVNGFSEILPLAGDRLLALEREFSNGAGHRVAPGRDRPRRCDRRRPSRRRVR